MRPLGADSLLLVIRELDGNCEALIRRGRGRPAALRQGMNPNPVKEKSIVAEK